GAVVASLLVVGGLGAFGLARAGSSSTPRTGHARTASRAWAQQGAKGLVDLTGHVPVTVATGKARDLKPHQADAKIRLSFGLPIRDKGTLDALIAQQAKTHTYLTRAQLYARFSPPQAQLNALRQWLVGQGLQVTHVGADRLALSVSGTTAQVQRALHVQ